MYTDYKFQWINRTAQSVEVKVDFYEGDYQKLSVLDLKSGKKVKQITYVRSKRLSTQVFTFPTDTTDSDIRLKFNSVLKTDLTRTPIAEQSTT